MILFKSFVVLGSCYALSCVSVFLKYWGDGVWSIGDLQSENHSKDAWTLGRKTNLVNEHLVTQSLCMCLHEKF